MKRGKIMKGKSSRKARKCATFSICLLFLFSALVGNASAAAPAQNVNVVNTPNVNVTNTPTVNLAPGASVGISGSANVVIGNPATNPVFTRDVDNPARLNWQMETQVNFSGSAVELATFGPPMPAPPPLKQFIFVIENFSARAQMPIGQLVSIGLRTNAGYTLTYHYFAPTFIGSDSGSGNDFFVLSQPTRLYHKTAVGGTDAPTISVWSIGPNTGAGTVLMSLSGYLYETDN
jgi:hypothetical protein